MLGRAGRLCCLVTGNTGHTSSCLEEILIEERLSAGVNKRQLSIRCKLVETFAEASRALGPLSDGFFDDDLHNVFLQQDLHTLSLSLCRRVFSRKGT